MSKQKTTKKKWTPSKLKSKPLGIWVPKDQSFIPDYDLSRGTCKTKQKSKPNE